MRYYKEINGETVFFTGNVLRTETHETLNPTHEQMLAAGWLVWQEPEPTAAELLAQAIAEKIAAIEANDASKEVFSIGGQQMWLGHEVRQQIRTSCDAYEATGATQMTKVFNGQEFTFAINLWRQMLNALEVYASEVLNATERHKAAVAALESVADVEAYDITTGYPSPLSFTV